MEYARTVGHREDLAQHTGAFHFHAKAMVDERVADTVYFYPSRVAPAVFAKRNAVT